MTAGCDADGNRYEARARRGKPGAVQCEPSGVLRVASGGEWEEVDSRGHICVRGGEGWD